MTEQAKFKKGDSVRFKTGSGIVVKGEYQSKILPTGTGRGHFVRAKVKANGKEYRPALSSLTAAN